MTAASWILCKLAGQPYIPEPMFLVKASCLSEASVVTEHGLLKAALATSDVAQFFHTAMIKVVAEAVLGHTLFASDCLLH